MAIGNKVLITSLALIAMQVVICSANSGNDFFFENEVVREKVSSRRIVNGKLVSSEEYEKETTSNENPADTKESYFINGKRVSPIEYKNYQIENGYSTDTKESPFVNGENESPNENENYNIVKYEYKTDNEESYFVNGKRVSPIEYKNYQIENGYLTDTKESPVVNGDNGPPNENENYYTVKYEYKTDNEEECDESGSGEGSGYPSLCKPGGGTGEGSGTGEVGGSGDGSGSGEGSGTGEGSRGEWESTFIDDE